MILELIKGLGLSAISFIVIIGLCAVIGKTAGYFSSYKHIR